MNIKELSKASYNPLTDEIIGCEPGTLIWWHEAGHRSTRSLCLISNMSMFVGIFMSAIFASAAALFKDFFVLKLAFVCMFTWSFFRLYLELYAWVYAFLHYWKNPHPNVSDGKPKE